MALLETRTYQSADEMYSDYADRRKRLDSLPAAPAKPKNTSRSVLPGSFVRVGRASYIMPPEIVGSLWKTPTVRDAMICSAGHEGAWRRYVDGACFVLIGGVEKYCPELSTHETAISLGAVCNEDGRDLRLPDGSAPRTNKDILKAVAAKHQMRVSEMLADRRDAYIVRARHEAMWWFKKLTTYSLPHIGQLFGGMDHTTILNGIRRHQARIDAGEA